MHTVDERMPVKGLMEMVRFYCEYIRYVCGKGTGEWDLTNYGWMDMNEDT